VVDPTEPDDPNDVAAHDLISEPERVRGIGRLLKATRGALKALKAREVLDAVVWEKDAEGLPRWTLPAPPDGDEEGRLKQQLVSNEIAAMLHGAALVAGWGYDAVHIDDPGFDRGALFGNEGDRSAEAGAILHHAERRASIKAAEEMGGAALSGSVEEKVIHGRCEEALKDRKLFAKHMVDVVLTDPPYGVYDAWRERTKVAHDSESTPEQEAPLVGRVAKILVRREIIKPRFMWFSLCPTDLVHIFLPPIPGAFGGENVLRMYCQQGDSG